MALGDEQVDGQNAVSGGDEVIGFGVEDDEGLVGILPAVEGSQQGLESDVAEEPVDFLFRWKLVLVVGGFEPWLGDYERETAGGLAEDHGGPAVNHASFEAYFILKEGVLKVHTVQIFRWAGRTRHPDRAIPGRDKAASPWPGPFHRPSVIQPQADLVFKGAV